MVETAIKCNEIINDDSLTQETKKLLIDDFHIVNELSIHVDMSDHCSSEKRIIKRKSL